MFYDKVIIGGGLYGLYSALLCGKNGQKVLVLEYDSNSFERATYINQARVHMGYHYPRSFSTAIKSAHYFERFMHDYSDCILTEFQQIYATSSTFSYTSADQFVKFCKAANIKCEEISPKKYFKDNRCDGAFLTREYTYDAKLLLKKLMAEIVDYNNIEIIYNVRIDEIFKLDQKWRLKLSDKEITTGFILNATYASCNQINKRFGFDSFNIKYELCEIILCDVNDNLKNVGITVMDGPFFSIMPFGKTGFHSLTSVTFTPHDTSYSELPEFVCQGRCENGFCSPEQLGNCNNCIARPESAWEFMSNLAQKYMREEYNFKYNHSLFSMKPILKASEVDDSRPTVVKTLSEQPKFISVLSGKINTVYDLDEVLLDE